MMRVVQLMVLSSSSSSSSFGVISSPFHRSWKPIRFGINKNLSTSTSKQPLLPFSSPLISSYHPINSNTITYSSFKIKSFTLSAHYNSNSNSNQFSSNKSQPLLKVYFCQWCGSATKQDIPDGDDKSRAICTSCGKVTYQNPKMVTGCLVEHDDKVLLCKRKITPSYGLWTLPAGYMEMGESAVEGATRETWEEAGAEVEVMSPFAQLDIPLIGQTYIIFRARLKTPQFSPGPESIECRLFALDEIPFDSLAFSSMLVTLKLYIEDLKAGKLSFHYGTINKRPGTGPSDIHSYTLDDHLRC